MNTKTTKKSIETKLENNLMQFTECSMTNSFLWAINIFYYPFLFKR